ncbi:DnaJ domain-containing protein [Bradyrhizobium septentrionale]|uniref:J domain-containing protein n=1 Tax=Bradyrhizobium septentrionale TaxID=1404411 RepID=UPI0030CD6F2C
MAKIDLYAVLGVTRDADPEVIRAAYRALAKKYHPDASKDESQDGISRFRLISDAHTVLSDPKMRSAYDLHLEPQPTPAYPSDEQDPVPASAKSRTSPAEPAQRALAEQARNAVAVVGWFLLGGFVLLLTALMLLGGVIGWLRQ